MPVDNPRYNVILTDPPWSYSGQQDKWGAAAKFYDTMTDEDIWNMHLPLASPGVVFVWATGPKLNLALKFLEEKDLYYRGVAFVWVKTKKDGTPIRAQGVRPSIVKPLTEFVLVGSTEAEGRPLPLGSESVIQTVFTDDVEVGGVPIYAPKGEHSAKPVEVMDRIDALYPDHRKLEMFSRGYPHGEMWDVWGNEAKVA